MSVPGTPTIWLHQELDETGAPDVAEFYRSFADRDTDDVLVYVAELHLVPTGEPAIYRYSDATGSGWLELVDFPDGARARIAELAAT
jgi:hypothetical protein